MTRTTSHRSNATDRGPLPASDQGILQFLKALPYGVVLNARDEIVAVGIAYEHIWRDGGSKRFNDIFIPTGPMGDDGVQEWNIGNVVGLRRKGSFLPTKDPELRLLNTWPAETLWYNESPLVASSTFLESMWHEMRNQLSAIMGVSEELLHDARDDEQRRELAAVARSSENLISLFNEIHLGLRSGSTGIHIRDVQVDLRKCVEQVVQVLVPLARATNTAMDVVVDPLLGTFHKGDSRRIDQVLLNLVGNALKYAPGGKVGLAVAAGPVENDRQHVEFRIHDDGVGISAGHMDNLFKPFERDPALAHSFPGTGLGLSICKDLVNAMRGEISVESEQGKGTTVIVRLDLPVLATAATEERTDGAGGSLPEGIDILIIEDGEPLRKVISSILRRQPINLYEAKNGAEAIELLCTHPMDVILVDLHLPVVDGTEFAQVVRDTFRSGITMISIDGDEPSHEKGKYFNCRVRKPFKSEALIGNINACLARGGNAQHERWDPGVGRSTLFTDLSAIREMGRGDAKFVRDISASFIQDAPRSVDEMLAAAKAHDSERVAAIAHRIRPALAMFGIHTVTAHVNELVRSKSPNADPLRISALCHVVQRNVKLAVKELSASNGTAHGE